MGSMIVLRHSILNLNFWPLSGDGDGDEELQPPAISASGRVKRHKPSWKKRGLEEFEDKAMKKVLLLEKGDPRGAGPEKKRKSSTKDKQPPATATATAISAATATAASSIVAVFRSSGHSEEVGIAGQAERYGSGTGQVAMGQGKKRSATSAAADGAHQGAHPIHNMACEG